MASLWKKKNGIWCVTFRQDGRQRVRSLRTKDKREALKLKRTIETTLDERGTVSLEVSDTPKPQPKNPTLTEFWETFETWAVNNRARSTVDEYRVWFFQFREFAKAKHLKDVTFSQVESFKAAITEQGRKKPKGIGLKKRSINNALRTLRAIWNHAIKLNLYTGGNPFIGVERYKLPQNLDRDYLDKEQVNRLLQTAADHCEEKYVRRLEAQNIYLAIALMALAGLRKREVCYARWEWIDWGRRTIVVNSDEYFTTKNRRYRTISMGAQLRDILGSFRKDEGYILVASRPSNGKTRYRVDFKNGFRIACEKAGIKATPHDLRHSFASRHAVAGTSLHVIAGWLGHSTTWITQRYAHFQKTFNEAADNI